MRDFNILPLVPHASGLPYNPLILIKLSQALAATDALLYLTLFNGSPQKSLHVGCQTDAATMTIRPAKREARPQLAQQCWIKYLQSHYT